MSDELSRLREINAKLLEALEETSAILQASCRAGRVSEGDSFRIGGMYLQTVGDALDAANAAIAAAKEAAQ